MFHHQATRPISELRYLSDIDLTINSFDHQKDSPIIHRHSKRLEFVADNQDGRGWMEKKKREKNETRKEKDTNNIGRMEREIRCVLSLSVFHFPLLHTPPLPLLRPLMRRSLSWPSSLRRISLTIGGGLSMQSRAEERTVRPVVVTLGDEILWLSKENERTLLSWNVLLAWGSSRFRRWRCVLPVWVEVIRITGYFFEVVLQGKDIGRGSRMFVVKKEKFLRNKIRLSWGGYKVE